jgi:methyl-accepting chemotaxis protein
VVASEVKELASQTSRATQSIADQIRAMQDSTTASVAALRSIAGQISQMETSAVSIATAVDQQTLAGQELARNIDIAARGTDAVSGLVGEVRETSLATGNAAAQVLASANELEGQANMLRGKVDHFLAQVRAG